MNMVKQGKLSKEIVEEKFHIVYKLFFYELWVCHGTNKTLSVIIDTMNNVYTWGSDILEITMCKDLKTWYHFKSIVDSTHLGRRN